VFDATVSAVLSALVGAFGGALVSRIAQPILDIMQASPFADPDAGHQSAITIINYLEVAVGNSVRAALLGALMVLLARAVVESEVVGA
jgi:hypothetical protein